jgi:hypothetical protein
VNYRRPRRLTRPRNIVSGVQHPHFGRLLTGMTTIVA